MKNVEWKPANADGTHWQLIGFPMRFYGSVARHGILFEACRDIAPAPVIYLNGFPSWRDAVNYVEEAVR